MKTIAWILAAAFFVLPAAADDAPWTKRVTETLALPDRPEKHEAMLALLREALPGITVRLSGSTHGEQVHPADNQPAPVVNFDPYLNEKSTYSANPRRLETSPAYYFVAQGKPYVVVGPNALNPKSPVFTRLHAGHELFHAKHHLGDPRPLPDRELETWTHMVVTYFRDLIPFKQKWLPLISFYGQSDESEQKAAVKKLVAFYRGADRDVQIEFDQWLARRRKDSATSTSKLVADLGKPLAEKPAEP
ncbi:MAG TPA: hypothetical protein VFL80_12170 [Thermoanaerobaculia bacterium]|nr:hypothetical protein [Thermoanaerobaculia bacterium]